MKRYRAYDESIDKWQYFKLLVDEKGWEIRHLGGTVGDKSNATMQDNFDVAYLNLQKIVDQLGYSKLTELNGSDA